MWSILRNTYRKFNKNYQASFLNKKEFFYFSNCKKILDIGCGTGDFIALDPKRIIGVDHNKKSLKVCKDRNMSVVYGKVTKLPFESDLFDGVHAAHVIEHLFPRDAYKMLAEVGRVLKKGGVFVLSTPLLWDGFYNDFTHIKPYNPESIIRYICSDGSQKTLSDMKSRFDRVDLYYRYRPFPFFGKFGYLLSNYIYQYGLHSFKKDAYTLILRKIK